MILVSNLMSNLCFQIGIVGCWTVGSGGVGYLLISGCCKVIINHYWKPGTCAYLG